MIEPEQWNSALSSITGTVVRGVERIATKDVLAFLGLPDSEAKRVPYAKLAVFLAALREQQGIVARALEFTILTASRSGETRGARWSEFDLLDKTWTIPGERMKAGREHRVPLAARALAILQEMQAHRHGDDGFVFSGKPSKPLSDMAFSMLLRRMGRGKITAHGFRATFKTWATDRTGSHNEIVEAALAHVVGSPVEQAYPRSDRFEKRRRLMQQWGAFCTNAPAQERPSNVAPMRRMG